MGNDVTFQSRPRQRGRGGLAAFLLIFAAVPASLESLFGILGCSVAMASHGEETPDLRQLSVGSTRGDVEKMLGSPVHTVPGCEAGYQTDTYQYKIGNEPSPGRAIFHGVMNAVTLATWETSMSPQGS